MDVTTGAVDRLSRRRLLRGPFSPDNRSAFLYNCHSEGVGEVKFRFYNLDLETSALTPSLADALNVSQEAAYRTLFAPPP